MVKISLVNSEEVTNNRLQVCDIEKDLRRQTQK